MNHLLRESFSHSKLNLDSSKPVLVQIVSIRNFEWQRAVAIAFPSAAKINGVVDPADLIITADAQRYGVILPIADIRKSDTAQNRCIECARRAKTIDAECIVSSVLAAPLAMVDLSLKEIPPGLIDHREWSRKNGRNNALRVNGLGAPRAFNTSLLRHIGFPNVSYGEDYAVALRISRDYEIGRIYDSVYLCRRWEGNSDNALPLEVANRYDQYKDWLRTIEIEARMRG